MNHIIIAKSDKFKKLIHECEALLSKGDKVILESYDGNKYLFYIKGRIYDPIKDEWIFLTQNTSGIDIKFTLEEYKKAIF